MVTSLRSREGLADHAEIHSHFREKDRSREGLHIGFVRLRRDAKKP